jgi:uncharacterized protein YbjT (DUF2867 family)
MLSSEFLFLVTGATGAQGGATARALLAAGARARILTRNPDGGAARELAARGAEVVKGDMDDTASLVAALQGVQGVFSVQVPDPRPTGADAERRQGFALVKAALQAGVRHFVHTSVCEAGRHTGFPRWGTGYWWEKYWTDKWDIGETVRAAGFARWTVLKPAFLMDNLIAPKAKWMFPHLRQGRIITALSPATRMQFTSADDVGAFARAAFADPDRFDRKSIDLGAQALTMAEVAAILSRVLHRRVAASHVSPDEAVAAGLFRGWVRSQEWTNEVGYRADVEALKRYDVPLTSLAEWVQRHAGQFEVENA